MLQLLIFMSDRFVFGLIPCLFCFLISGFPMFYIHYRLVNFKQLHYLRFIWSVFVNVDKGTFLQKSGKK